MKLIVDLQRLRHDRRMIQINLLHGHFVLCKRARLIRTDHRHTAQTLHRLQIFDDRMLPRHFLGSHRLHDCHDRAEGFRNRRNCKRDRKHHRVQKRHIPVH